MSFLEGGDGLPILFLHGIPGSANSWAGVGQQLADQYRVIIPDLAGFGYSDPPSGDYYMEEQARYIRMFLESIGVKEFILAGHDFGAPVALTLMRLYPDMTVQALIVSATNLFTDTYVPYPLRVARVPILGRIFFRLVAGSTMGLSIMFRLANRQGLSAPEEHLVPFGRKLTWKIFHRSLSDLPGNYGPLQKMLDSIRVPTLVLWGDSDPFFNVDVGQRIVGSVPDAQLRILDNTGHFVPEEQSVQVAVEVAHFLASIDL
jgi:pimeloyl-ACP methyl ester carboxylesterase